MKKILTTFAAGVFAIASGITAAAAEPVKVVFVYLTNPGDH
jgi:TPP-dependent 2-oxoacid decarboxylase